MRGPEIAAELPASELVAALPSLLPSGWVCGVDDATPNTAQVFVRPRERCAALEIDVGHGDFSVRDLEAGATELSRRHGARVILWDDELGTTVYLELQAGEPIARLDRSHAGDYQGVTWHALLAREAPPPFPVELLPLLEGWRDAEFIEGLRRWQHGTALARGEPVAQIFRRYVTREPSPALSAVWRAAFRRARSTGSAQLMGFGRLLWRANDNGGRVAVRPARSLLRFFDGGGRATIDFSRLETRLGAGAVAQAEREMTEAVTAARDSRSDVVLPGLLCITTRHTPAFTSKNPRDGSTFTIPGHLQPFFIFGGDGPTPAAAHLASPLQSPRT
jgi:hypothetical protein